MVDPSKSFCLQWDKFTASCSGTFRSLLENEEFSDVTLYCGGKFLRCHRVILSASSQFFKTLLQNVKQPSALIAVPNIELPLLEAIIRFIYTGEVTIASHQLDALVKTGEMLKVNGLGDEEAIEDTEENIADSAFRPPVKRRRTEKVNNIQNIPAVPEEEPLVRSDEVLTVSGSSVKQETSFAENPDVNEARNIEDYDEKLLEGFGENSLNASGAEAYDETSLCMDPLEGSTSRQAENEREDDDAVLRRFRRGCELSAIAHAVLSEEDVEAQFGLVKLAETTIENVGQRPVRDYKWWVRRLMRAAFTTEQLRTCTVKGLGRREGLRHPLPQDIYYRVVAEVTAKFPDITEKHVNDTATIFLRDERRKDNKHNGTNK